ncbi:MAG: L-glutamate gamma-semialdehyde dehydrogenase [Bacteroidetes bacterium]|nr:L-glutamate gamma-semialdehyde dehydrogenase [Bacteroidota bacterium]
MSNGIFNTPSAENEPIRSYAPGTSERESLKDQLASLKSEERDIPMVIGGKEVTTGETVDIHPPHEIGHKLGHWHKGDVSHVEQAIKACAAAKSDWEHLPWENRASVFLKAADLIAGPYRDEINAATMLGQSKNPFQAEIDAACEMIDFFRFNVQFMSEIYKEQPESAAGVWNRVEYRALEGFLLAVTPFNFTCIGGNLSSAPALMGNTVVWKPSRTQIYSAWVIMKVLKEAGLPDGVINIIYSDGRTVGDLVFAHPDFAGVHFTGSTGVFQHMWKTIGDNIDKYKGYPRIVGETGGKDFVMVHASADAAEVATALSRGAFEYQGQKCSAASRAYIPTNLWKEVKQELLEQVDSFKMGTVEDFSNFINAVIDEASFDNIISYIDSAKADGQDIIAGGNYNKSEGYFIEPTIIVAKDPMYTTMCEEIFGPVLTIHVYDENKYEETLKIVDKTSIYALTGSIFARDRYALETATKMLSHSAGNFYINVKPTGAVVGQQPFGGARASGTDDKAGSKLNLIRWVSARTIKETFVPPKDYRYPFLDAE